VLDTYYHRVQYIRPSARGIPMITLFTMPKPFEGHLNIIQRNAIKSWRLLGEDVEILLLGDEIGTAEAARDFNARHLPEIACNENGTPLVNSIFETGQAHAQYDRICYINTDIILMSDFSKHLHVLDNQPTLLAGRRWDLDVPKPINFDNPAWESHLLCEIRVRGRLMEPSGIDYFATPRQFWGKIPLFALGRLAWDSWLLWHARCDLNARVIDATAAITVIHQNHDYNHHKHGLAGVWYGPEASENLRLAGGFEHCYTLLESNWQLLSTGELTERGPCGNSKTQIYDKDNIYSMMIFYNQASRMIFQDQRKEAAEIFNNLKAEDYNVTGCDYHLAEIKLLDGDIQGALCDFEKILDHLPNHRMARLLIMAIKSKAPV